jgi:putative ABC transport system substrate-binding protein
MFNPIKSRLLAIFAAALVTLIVPPVVQAQNTKPTRIAILRNSLLPPQYLTAFRECLKDYGFVEGKSYVLIQKTVKVHQRLTVPKSLIGKVDIFVTEGSGITRGAAKAATQVEPNLPVVFASSGAPVRRGLVKSLAAPGGNVTGVYSGSLELMAKRVEILKQLVPGMRRLAVMTRGSPLQKMMDKETARAARMLGFEVVIYKGKSLDDLIRLIKKSKEDGVDGWNIRATPRYSLEQRKRLVKVLNETRMPAVLGTRQLAQLGGLVTYGTNRSSQYRLAAAFVAKILRGAKPADLPVERPAKFGLVVNLKAARHLGITVPPAILLRADELIQ